MEKRDQAGDEYDDDYYSDDFTLEGSSIHDKKGLFSSIEDNPFENSSDHLVADTYEDGKFDQSYDGEEFLSPKLNDDEENLTSPAISFTGHFGAPPESAHTRRNLTNRQVKLTKGNLILDCGVPTRLKSFLPRRGEEEFDYSRYTAVTCAPENYNKEEYILRPTLYNRETELLIVVTMYNEDEVLFCRTLHGVMKNISQLCARKNSRTWGPDGWKKIVVCIVADGRKAVHPRVLDCLAALGVYQPGVATNRVDSRDVKAHVYEYTTQLGLTPELEFSGLEKGLVPTQVMFCLKEHNEGKLNSHRWALQAFAPQLDPNVVMLIDVGTKPESKSLYYLWKAFDSDSNVGGACGEIVTMKGNYWRELLNPLVAAQDFEYKISNILDKPLESMFGYISVLPGAFSAYRYHALKNDDLGHGPLESYFKGEQLTGSDADVFTSNMYLAEDRILCWELVARADHNWVLKFVKASHGETDVPDQVAEFISQRRRWLNGSFFASVYALTHTAQLFKTDHSMIKKVALMFQAVYQLLNLAFSWFGLGNYWIFFMVLTTSMQDYNIKGIKVINTIIQYIYQGTIIALFIFSMGNKPKSSKWKYTLAMASLCFTSLYMFVSGLYCIYKAFSNGDGGVQMIEIVVSIISTYGCYVIASLINLDPWHLLTSMFQYILFSPIYINLLPIYAYSNLHDFSWGTKDQTSSELDLGVTTKVSKDTVDMVLPSEQADIDEAYNLSLHDLKTRPMIIPAPQSAQQMTEAKIEYYKSVRTNVLLLWVLSNAVLVWIVLDGDYSTTFDSGSSRTKVYITIILVFVAFMSLVRLVGSTLYVIDYAVRMYGPRLMDYLSNRNDSKLAKQSMEQHENAEASGAAADSRGKWFWSRRKQEADARSYSVASEKL